MPTASENFVTLRSGPSIPLAAVLLALRLEERGLTLSADGDVLVVRPANQLSDEDRAEIRQLKPYLLALANYTPPEVH